MPNPMTIPSDELQDFWAGCASLGVNPQDFQVSAMEVIPVNPGPIQRTVTVQRGNVARLFEGSSGHDWIEPALNAIKAGLFDKK